MVSEAMEEARQMMREMPGFTAAFLVLVALCVGVRCGVFLEADGEHLKVLAGGHVEDAVFEETDTIGRMRARRECPFKTPGFTVIVGLREYEMELSIPVASVEALLEDARSFAHMPDRTA